MKKTIINTIVALVATIFTTNANAQQWKDHWTDYQWTNGYEMVSSVRLNDNQVLLVAHGLFDAGYGYLFEIKSLGDTNYDMKGIPESAVKSRPQNIDELVAHLLDENNCNGDDGQIWKRRDVGGHDILIRYGEDNSISTVYIPTGRDLREVANESLQEIIVGSYTSTKGKKFQFNDDGTCIFDGTPNTYYMAEEGEYGAPSFHITLNRQIWELEPTADGMKIYNTFFRNDVDGIQRGRLYATLKSSKNTPRWAFSSDRPLIGSTLYEVDKDVLRLMRNEIYARHGYRFSDKKLQAYFESCKWYKAIDDNKYVNLTALETINVALIKAAEK